jgi:hypothetical protein
MSADMRQGMQGLFIVCQFIYRPAVFKSLVYVETLWLNPYFRGTLIK